MELFISDLLTFCSHFLSQLLVRISCVFLRNFILGIFAICPGHFFTSIYICVIVKLFLRKILGDGIHTKDYLVPQTNNNLFKLKFWLDFKLRKWTSSKRLMASRKACNIA